MNFVTLRNKFCKKVEYCRERDNNYRHLGKAVYVPGRQKGVVGVLIFSCFVAYLISDKYIQLNFMKRCEKYTAKKKDARKNLGEV